ncbi:conserved hypothetical protein [Ricinus communis]|uniref:Uncharacterized protein n=1 Tax=Ricinus communis TaxID=3988 RepID=B9RE90_RICCO|nr:conserved hypothetical protein [Ricinus communis]
MTSAEETLQLEIFLFLQKVAYCLFVCLFFSLEVTMNRSYKILTKINQNQMNNARDFSRVELLQIMDPKRSESTEFLFYAFPGRINSPAVNRKRFETIIEVKRQTYTPNKKEFGSLDPSNGIYSDPLTWTLKQAAEIARLRFSENSKETLEKNAILNL